MSSPTLHFFVHLSLLFYGYETGTDKEVLKNIQNLANCGYLDYVALKPETATCWQSFVSLRTRTR